MRRFGFSSRLKRIEKRVKIKNWPKKKKTSMFQSESRCGFEIVHDHYWMCAPIRAQNREISLPENRGRVAAVAAVRDVYTGFSVWTECRQRRTGELATGGEGGFTKWCPGNPDWTCTYGGAADERFCGRRPAAVLYIGEGSKLMNGINPAPAPLFIRVGRLCPGVQRLRPPPAAPAACRRFMAGTRWKR